MDIRKYLGLAIVIAAPLCVVANAEAQSSHAAAPAKANAAEPANKAADKAADKADKAADKADKAADKADKAADKMADKAADKGEKGADKAADRDARKAKEHAAEKEKLRAMLKGAPDEALKQEERRHAERLARLDRIHTLATTAKDKDATERATKLITKENERHDKWMTKHTTESKAGAQ